MSGNDETRNCPFSANSCPTASFRHDEEMIEVIEADITTLTVDVIVNAANESLLGGGGVDGAIHRAAGPKLLAACRTIPEVRPGVRCPTGEARITDGFTLTARHIVHTVGPIWQGGDKGEAALLCRCYENSLHLAADHGARSIAFPAISCGVYGYPLDQAAQIALQAIHAWMAAGHNPQRVIACCFDADTAAIYRKLLSGRSDR